MAESYDNKYRIGVYGSRNICQKVCSLTKAESSFVADMSTGYSGNLGYSMPNNWAFEQFHEYSILGSGFSFAVYKDMASGRYKGISADAEIFILTSPGCFLSDEISCVKAKALKRCLRQP